MAQAPSESSKSDTKSSADETPPKSYIDLVSTLVLYRNYWLNPERLEHIIPVKDHFKPRRDDIILATYPKCGTTWLKALAFTVMTRGRHAPAAAGHPLLTGRHPQEVVAHLEVPTPAGDLAGIDKMPSPRLLATHLPLSLLPPAVAASDCRVVCAEHVLQGILAFRALLGALPRVLEGEIGEARAGPFLKYEEIASDPVEVVRTLAGFFAVPFTEEEERRVPEEVVRLCSFEMLSGLEHNQARDVARGDSIVVGKSMFFRKGKVGDWENHMSKEMAKKLDDVIEDKLKGSGLVF
ncbi:flavonol 4-sulfotransferase [Panicum miliaceum]|uniref:Sulfotransferase n=1 Tax=Panicum miliaceum TaxID=4540 RepID=A0A3L6SGV6_PANMI|nr:flavonol 4-sulfotransferase [Panicum miliaceum]